MVLDPAFGIYRDVVNKALIEVAPNEVQSAISPGQGRSIGWCPIRSASYERFVYESCRVIFRFRVGGFYPGKITVQIALDTLTVPEMNGEVAAS